jgi:hypothetical protein
MWGTAHVPQYDRSVRVLHDQVGVTVAEQIARAFDVPSRAGITLKTNVGAANVPQHDRAVCILEQESRMRQPKGITVNRITRPRRVA